MGTAYFAVRDVHAELSGMRGTEAESCFMMECQTLPEYGTFFYQVSTPHKGKKMGSEWLGISVRGIVLYNIHRGVKTPFTHWPWSQLKHLSYDVSCKVLLALHVLMCAYMCAYELCEVRNTVRLNMFLLE